jgi:hypothetical protein
MAFSGVILRPRAPFSGSSSAPWAFFFPLFLALILFRVLTLFVKEYVFNVAYGWCPPRNRNFNVAKGSWKIK